MVLPVGCSGPMFIGDQLGGVYDKTKPNAEGGYKGIAMLFRADKHQSLFSQAIERSRNQL
jgi:hypothetical protein